MRWLLTYADLITLLMVFFVVLYSMSRVDAEKYRSLKDSLQRSMGGVAASAPANSGGGASPDPNQAGGTGPLSNPGGKPPLEELGQQLANSAAAMGFGDRVTIYYGERGLTVSMGPILFDLGSADLRPDGIKVLDLLADVLNTIPNHVSVEGFTDDLPISTPQFPSNWELSAVRATSVIHYFVKTRGMPPGRFFAVGYGEYRPSVPNVSDENRARNRRVDIVILAQIPKIDKGTEITPDLSAVPGASGAAGATKTTGP